MELPDKQAETLALIDVRLEQLQRIQKEIAADSEKAVRQIGRVQERVQEVEKRVKRKGWIFW